MILNVLQPTLILQAQRNSKYAVLTQVLISLKGNHKMLLAFAAMLNFVCKYRISMDRKTQVSQYVVLHITWMLVYSIYGHQNLSSVQERFYTYFDGQYVVDILMKW